MSNTQISVSPKSNVYLNIPNSTTAIFETEKPCNLILNSNITNLFNGCSNLVMSLSSFKSNFSFNDVVYMGNAFHNCYNIIGSPACGPNTEVMTGAYSNCHNLTGSPVCGNNVTQLMATYEGCTNLNGCPVIGKSVVNATAAYRNASFYSAIDFDIEGVSLRYLNQCFNNVTNLGNVNLYLFYNEGGSVYATKAFSGKPSTTRVNIYALSNSTWNNWLYNSAPGNMLAGTFTWTLDTGNSVYYNAANNIYVYYVDSYDNTILIKSFNTARDWGLVTSYVSKLVHFELV